MKYDITPIIEALIALFSALITAFVIPLIKSRLTQSKLENLKFWVRLAVQAAEQVFGRGMGEKKKEYVVSFLLSKGIVFDVDEVNALIESEVYALTQEKI